MAAPLREALEPAGLLHAAGRGAVPQRTAAAVSRAGAGADPAAGARRRSVHRGQRLLRAVHGRRSSRSRRPDRRRAARHQHGRVRTAGQAPSDRVPRSATSRASRRKRACTCWPTPTCAPPAHAGGAQARLEVAGYMAAVAGALSRRSARAVLEGAGLRTRFSYRGAVDRDGKLAFLRRARRAVGAGDLRRAEGHVPARGDGERRAGRAAAPRRVHRGRREDRRRPAGGCRTIPTALADGLHALVDRPAIARARWAARRSRACARTTRFGTRPTA